MTLFAADRYHEPMPARGLTLTDPIDPIMHAGHKVERRPKRFLIGVAVVVGLAAITWAALHFGVHIL